MKVICIKCGKNGSLIRKTTISKGKPYKYFYVEHSTKGKNSWCYIGKVLPKEYTQTPYTNHTQIHTQTELQKNPRIGLLSQKSMVRGVGFEPTNPYGTAASGLRLQLANNL